MQTGSSFVEYFMRQCSYSADFQGRKEFIILRDSFVDLTSHHLQTDNVRSSREPANKETRNLKERQLALS